jgi:hypothetical protein
MAQKAAVVRATLGSTLNATTDFTSSGFGTVSAAIIIASSANTGANPDSNLGFHVGFWDGTNQRASLITAVDAGGTTATARMSDDSYAVVGTGPSGWAASAITDGIRLTLNPDATSIGRYCTVILLGGISAKVLTFTPNATQNSTQASASLGFAPKLVFFTSIGNTTADTASGTLEAQLSFGFAADDTTHRMVAFSSKHGAADEDATIQYSETRAVGQVVSGSLVWSGEVTTFGADTFTMTTRDGGTSSDVTFALALGGTDLSFDTGTLTTLTSTGTDVISTGIAPDAVLAMLSTVASTTIAADSTANGFMVGMADDTNEYSHSVFVEDGAATTNAESIASASNLINLDSSSSGSRTDLVTGTVAFDADSFDVTYSAVSGTARKGWWVAFGRVPHTTTGALVGPGSTLAGTAQHRHATTGALTGPGSTLSGSATHSTTVTHTTTGALTGAGATITGIAQHRHRATGVLVGPGSVIVGSAQHRHRGTGVLVGPGSVIVGAAQHRHRGSGVLTGPGSTLSGVADHPHTTSGVLAGSGSSLAGAAAHTIGSPTLTGTDLAAIDALIVARIPDIARGVWQEVLDSGFSAEELMRLFASVLAGKVSGAGTGTETFRDLADTKARIVATVDASGNRTALTRDAT